MLTVTGNALSGTISILFGDGAAGFDPTTTERGFAPTSKSGGAENVTGFHVTGVVTASMNVLIVVPPPPSKPVTVTV
jgi:hypothetical protein